MKIFTNTFLKIMLTAITIASCTLTTNAVPTTDTVVPTSTPADCSCAGKVVNFTVTHRDSLENILGTKVNKLTTKDTAIITIKSAVSRLQKRHYDLKCNLILQGDTALSTPPKIYFEGNDFDNPESGDDALIAVTGNSPQDRVSVVFEDLEFMRPTKGSGYNIFTKRGMYLIKIWFASSVIFNNVTSTLENGMISTLDIRASDNITVNGCRFINNNGLLAGNTHGCILQLRGNMNNVHVTNNYFQKYGNDELLAIFGNAAPYNKLSGLFTDAENTYVYRRNITVTGNTFIYKKPTSSSKDCPTDVMITFGPTNSAAEGKETQKVFYENVWVAYNNIEVNEHARRVFSFLGLQDWREAANFQVCHNTITHAYENSDNAYQWTYDFCLMTTSKSPLTPPCITFAGNVINAREKLASGGFGHVCFGLNGGTAKAFNNKLYGTSGRTQIKPFLLHEQPSRLEFSYNTCTETVYSGQIERVPYCELLMRGNSMRGNSKLYFYRGNKLDQTQTAHVVMEDNFFVSGGFELVCQEFSYNGSLRVNGNTWYINRAGNGTQVVPYATYNTATCNLTEAVFTNNVITGNRYVGDTSLPGAEVTVVSNNDLGKP